MRIAMRLSDLELEGEKTEQETLFRVYLLATFLN